MYDAEQFLKSCVARHEQEVSRDYFIYHAFQHEFCLNAENSKKFVVTSSWLEQHDPPVGNDFSAALRAMYDWYSDNYPSFCAKQLLTFTRLYFYLPLLINFVREARSLWEKLHAAPPSTYAVVQPFWKELVALLQEACPHHHLIVPWLQWRYGEYRAPLIAAENLPPNPFTARPFAMRRGGERRESGNRRGASATRRDGMERKSRGHAAVRSPRRGATTRRDERGRTRGRASTSRHTVERASSNKQVVATLSAAMSSEIEAAVAAMQHDDAHPGVTLKPANSYFRRLQHRMVANMGFSSISVGDGRENRAVKIVRGS